MLTLSPDEKKRYELAQSIETMAGTDAWGRLLVAMTNLEAESVAKLEAYLDTEAHPDREEVMTMVLQWHARRAYRKMLLQNVEDAKDYRRELKMNILEQYAQNPQQPVAGDVVEMITEGI